MNEAQGLPGGLLGNAGDLEHDAAGLDHGHPPLGRALPIRIAEVKKDIARVKTILREQQGR